MYSIIVPIYRVEEYLPECIESILAQTYKNFELILVDDGSPDNCPAICDEYAQKDSRIKVIHKMNGGVVSARKAGVKKATGDYVCFVDGDDFISEDLLENYEKILKKERVDIICTDYCEWHENDVIKKSQGLKQVFLNKNEMITEIYPKMLSVRPFFSFYIIPSLWTKCFSRKYIDRIYDEISDELTLGEDVAVTYPVFLAASSMCVTDYCGYMYRQNPQSMTHAYNEGLYEKIKILIEWLKTVKEKMSWEDNGQIDEYALYMLILVKNNEFKYNHQASYKQKKQNMLRFVNDPIFKDVMKNVRINGVKNRLFLFCLKKRCFLPMYLYEGIFEKISRDEKYI